MFGFSRKSREERAKREVLRIGNAAAGHFKAILDRWKATSLSMRRTMLEDAFAERVVEIEPEGDLSFEHVAEIEALALMANWTERTGDYLNEFFEMLGNETFEILQTVGAEGEIDAQVGEALNSATVALNDNLTHMIREAVLRRGEIPDGS